MELKEQLEQLGKAFDDFKKANDSRLLEIKSKSYASPETETKVNKIEADLQSIETKIEGLTAALNRTAAGAKEVNADVETKTKWAEYSVACSKFMRKGIEVPTELMDFAKKTMSVDSDEDGGFLVRPEFSTTMIEKIFESSPIRQLASVISISSDMYEMLHDLDEAGSGWVGEIQARPETSTPKLQKEMVPVHELYAFPQATQKLLDDAGVNLESWLAGKVTSKFARDEATAFVNGNGTGKPKGILSYASGDGFGKVERQLTATNAAIVGDDLINAQSLLKEPYQNNATWLINRLIVGTIRKLKGSPSGDYLWQPGLGQGVPPTLLGRPVMYAADLPSTVSATTDTIMYGDFRAGYLIVDRIGIRVLRDALTSKPYVGFYTTKRVGGAVQNFEAVKVLKIAT